MKKEDLTALGLSDEQIAGVQKLNGLDVEAEKKKVTKAEGERDNYKEQLDTATTSLEKFKDIDVDKLQGEVETLKTTLASKDTEYQQKIADRDFSDKLNSFITKAGGKNAKAIMALLDVDAIKQSKNQDTDLQAAIEKCKTDNGYMFGANEPFQNPVGQTNGGGGNAGITAETFAKMGYNQRMKIFSENPTLYKQLSGKECKQIWNNIVLLSTLQLIKVEVETLIPLVMKVQVMNNVQGKKEEF